MKFVREKGSVKCVRTAASDSSGSSKEVIVATFGEQIDTVPPHVAAKLAEQEIKELERWLQERSALQAKLDEAPVEKTLLETLPTLLQKVTGSLENIDALDMDLFKSIKISLLKLDRKLNDFHTLTEEEILELDTMQDNEVLKEQLITIKNKL